jgi:hypothetical protein
VFLGVLGSGARNLVPENEFVEAGFVLLLLAVSELVLSY